MVFSEEAGETVEVLNTDEEEQEENAIRDWLETTRQSGCVLCHDSPRLPVSSLIYCILGIWKDDKAKITSVPFCHRLIQVAKASCCEELISFVQDNIIPCVIRRLTLEPNLDSTLLTGLCREAYHCVQNQCSYSRDLFEKLKPEFVSRYAIDSASHHYVWTMSSMLSRKISAKYWQRKNDEMCKFYCELIDFKPYIQGLCAMLSWLEPQFHPLIHEGHKDVLAEIFHHSFYLCNITHLQPLQPNLGDFPAHLRPCARNYIDENNKMRRAKLLGRRDQLCSYYQHLRQVVHNEQLRIGLQSLMCELKAEGQAMLFTTSGHIRQASFCWG